MNRQRRPQQDRRNKPSNDHRSAGNVPRTSQVVPGATVSIVLKADQPTGREVQGIVKDLLTRGDHPRGIKVRLQDGRIGRVQRMVPAGATTSTPVYKSGPRDVRLDDYAEGPPARTLANYLPSEPEPAASKTVKCPFCDGFEGDEVAVSHHVEEHLKG